ncbi:MAG TPA: hypothetical protein VNX88_17555 [Terriglobales bacterium]|jgi:hypothetical protein|nr:hypothetical protein [Terriglobales bacterium]
MNVPLLLRKIIAIQILGQTALIVAAQQAAPNPKALSATFSERLAFGKSMYVKNEHGSNIPFDVINTDIQGWGRFVMLNTEANADFIAEVTSYGSGSVTVGSTADHATPDGKPRQSTGARKDLSSASVTLKIHEAKTGRELWSGSEKVKSAFKKKAEEDNIVAAAEKLFLRFHDAVEPPKP